MAPLTIEEHEAELAELRGRVKELDTEFAGTNFTDEARTEYNDTNEQIDAKVELIEELRARQERVAELSDDPKATERTRSVQTHRPGTTRGEDIYDLSGLRMLSPEQANRELRDRTLRFIDQAVFPHPVADRARVQEHIEKLVDRFQGDDETDSLSTFGRRVLSTGSPLYRKAFGKAVLGRPLSAEEQRALSLASTAGYAVPVTLDPTIIPTSNSSVNPYRAIARVETITGYVWNGVSSGAITAAYAAEGTEAGDNTPTLAQPTATVERAQAFVPFSIESGQDWGSMQSEMATLFQDAKDDLEATKFTTGAGHGSTEPEGVLTGATGTVAAGSAAFAIGHLYSLEEALAPRFRPRATFVANRAQYNRVRQFDTSGGAGLWVRVGEGLQNQVPTPGNIGNNLLGYPAYECSAMSSTLTNGQKIMLFGDFRYFLIVDRIGMDIEIVPHLFGASGRPTGQRGLYAIWRNTSDVLSTAAFKTLVTTAS